MTDAHDAQDYTANGPTDVGFRTGGDNTGIDNGVVATGTKIGVKGIGAGIDGSSAETYGVVGESSRGIGVQGTATGGAFPGVYGFSEHAEGVKGEGPTGVYGEGGLVGVRGGSDSGIGVRGRSKTGAGGWFESTSDRGGVFRSDTIAAQIRLVPLQEGSPLPTLPRRGKVGDLILRRSTVTIDDGNGTPITRDLPSLWLCIPTDPSSEDSDQWQEIVLGNKRTGTF